MLASVICSHARVPLGSTVTGLVCISVRCLWARSFERLPDHRLWSLTPDRRNPLKRSRRWVWRDQSVERRRRKQTRIKGRLTFHKMAQVALSILCTLYSVPRTVYTIDCRPLCQSLCLVECKHCENAFLLVLVGWSALHCRGARWIARRTLESTLIRRRTESIVLCRASRPIINIGQRQKFRFANKMDRLPWENVTDEAKFSNARANFRIAGKNSSWILLLLVFIM